MELLVGAGISGIIVEAVQVESVKRSICELDAEECRQRYWDVLEMARPG